MRKHILLLVMTIAFFANNIIAGPVNNLGDKNKVAAITTVDTVLMINANPAAGFNFPYFLRIPKGLNASTIQYLLVETNNGGVHDNFSYHENEAYLETIRKSLGSNLCTNLKLPFLVPVFPRPATQWKLYTHALDRDVALIKEGELKRLDLQLIAMIEHAKQVLKEKGITTKQKFFINGFSASGTFANRFTMIHPELVAATACGGINAMPILPVATLENNKLNYPVGIHDFKKIFGADLNMEAFKKVPQLLYMGEKDTNDAVLFDDAYSKSDRKLIFKLLGKELVPGRFTICEKIYDQAGMNAAFKIFPAISHETEQTVFMEVYTFFKKITEKD